jgi:uncharacterized membrane protein
MPSRAVISFPRAAWPSASTSAAIRALPVTQSHKIRACLFAVLGSINGASRRLGSAVKATAMISPNVYIAVFTIITGALLFAALVDTKHNQRRALVPR